MRISDWSSDVCSSDLPKALGFHLSLEPMRVEHLDEVTAIEQKVQAFPWTKGNFADGLQAGYGAWVVTQSGRTLGFCMTMFAPDVAHVLVIAVSPEGQRQGIGSQDRKSTRLNSSH